MKVSKLKLVKAYAKAIGVSNVKSNKLILSLFELILKEVSEGNGIVLPLVGILKVNYHKGKRHGFINGSQTKSKPSFKVKLSPSYILRAEMLKLYNQSLIENTQFFKQ